jgi:hypothetical protein
MHQNGVLEPSFTGISFTVRRIYPSYCPSFKQSSIFCTVPETITNPRLPNRNVCHSVCSRTYFSRKTALAIGDGGWQLVGVMLYWEIPFEVT